MTAGHGTRSTFRADVQGMRAIAVLLVLLYHAGVSQLPGGYVGVDVFFVVSGFLITSQLVSSIERHGRVRFGDFYARRARRILPAALVVAALTAIAVVIWYPVRQVAEALQAGIATVLYVPNFWFAWQETDYLADHAASPFQHYWSLGIEEQFYLFWPLILVLVFWLAKRRRGIVLSALAVLFAASLVGGALLTSVNQPYAFFMLPTRAWELMAGGLVALALPMLRGRISEPVRAVAGWAGLAAILGAALVFDADVAFPGWAALLPVAGAAAVVAAGAEPGRWGPTALLSIRPAQHIGKLSYALYLVHWPLLIVPQGASGFTEPMPLWLSLLLGLPVAYVAAVLLHRFVEEPVRAHRALTSRRPGATLRVAAAATVALFVTLGATTAWAEARPTPTGGRVAAAETPTEPPAAPGFVPSNLDPSLEVAADDLPVVYADDCQHNQQDESLQDCHYGPADAEKRIAVFGDSHSAQWFPAVRTMLDEGGDVGLDAYTKSFCPAVQITPVLKGQPYESCERWRDKVMRELLEHPVDLVVMSSSAFYEIEGADSESERQERWRQGTEDVVSQLTAAGSKVLVISDTPKLAQGPIACLSAVPLDAERCAQDRDDALDEPLSAIEAAAVQRSGGTVLDLTRYFCTDAECPAIIDNVLVYRDINHITATMARHLAPEVTTAIRQLL